MENSICVVVDAVSYPLSDTSRIGFLLCPRRPLAITSGNYLRDACSQSVVLWCLPVDSSVDFSLDGFLRKWHYGNLVDFLWIFSLLF